LKSKLTVKRRDRLLLAVFYVTVGVAQIVILALSNFRFYPSGVFAVLSLMAAYGLLTSKKWSVWLVIGLFFPQVVFGASTLYAFIIWYSSYPEISLLLLDALLISFIILSLISFVYVAAKRKTFQPA